MSQGRRRLLPIGAFARRSRLSTKALRLYERLGLLTPAEVDPDNGYRWYREDQLFTARLIVGLRRLDMPLSGVAQVISVPGEAGAQLVASYWEGVERRVALQGALAGRLRQSLVGGEARFAEFDVRERDVPERMVLSERRRVDLRGLPDMLTDASSRLTARAEARGGRAGEEIIVVFHGEVNEDADGPVEVCVPVRTASPGAWLDRARREAYVTVTKAQLDWPQILSAYDAVEHWMEAHSQVCAGSPREIYRSSVDPASAVPTQEVCDIAFPIE